MKKLFLLLLVLPVALQVFSQTDDSNVQNIDFEEDTTQVTSLDDIITFQEMVYEQNYRSNVIKNVWKRKKYFTMSYSNTTLKGDGLMVYNPTPDVMEERNMEFKTDLAFTMKRSNMVAFHKKPIAQMVSIGLEYSLFDLAVNHYKQDENMKYNSSVTFEEETDNYKDDGTRHYLPWGSEMFTFAYSVHIGPALTVAPFAKLRSEALAHIRLHGYYGIGYRAALMWLRADEKKDMNDPRISNTNKTLYESVKSSTKLTWGHDMLTTWGIRLMWKGIGIGYEAVSGEYEFEPIETDIYGKGKFKFSEKTQRFTLSYIW